MDKKVKKPTKDVISKISEYIIYVVMAIIAFSLLVPLIWMVINSFKGYIEYYLSSPFDLPKSLSFDNYAYAIKHLNVTQTTSKGRFTYNFIEMIGTSFIYSTSSTLVNVFLSTCCAYVIFGLFNSRICSCRNQGAYRISCNYGAGLFFK